MTTGFALKDERDKAGDILLIHKKSIMLTVSSFPIKPRPHDAIVIMSIVR